MTSFIQSCVRGALKGLLRLIGGIFLVLLLVLGFIWFTNRPRPQWEIDAALARATQPGPTPTAVPSQWVSPPMTQKELQALIVDFYHVESSQFIRPDLLNITFGPNERDPQGKCQAIANIWSFRSGLNDVMVESWSGKKRIGFGVVVNGNLRDP